MTHINIHHIKCTDIKPNPNNARQHSKAQIKKVANSIQEFGFLVPILIDDKKQIIAGHCRLAAAKKNGLKTVPTIKISHLTDAQKRAYMIADNRLTEIADWDNEILAIEFQALQDIGFSMELTGFELPEINMIVEETLSLDTSTQDEGADILPDTNPDEPAVSKPGDLWLLGEHRLYCGDALKEESYKALMDGKKAAMGFSDPPYNVPTKGHICGLGKIKHREFLQASGEMSKAEFTSFLNTYFKRISDHSKKAAIHYICMDWRHTEEVLSAAATTPFEQKNLCVWVKDNAGMGSFYRSQHEMIFVFKNGPGKHINNFALGQYGRHRSNVWKYNGINSLAGRNGEEGNLLELHPTVKPVEMVADAIRDCSNHKDIIFDGFLGSGTTLIAAEKTERICYGIELDPIYLDTIIRRWQAMTGQEATLEKNGLTFYQIRKGEKND